MKKLFVSVPMRGRTEAEIRESIEKMHKVAEIYEGEKLELIDSYVEDTPPQNTNEAIWYLGKSIEKLAEADVFIGIHDPWEWTGCYAEKTVADGYRIKRYFVWGEDVIDNYEELCRKNSPVAVCEVE